MLCHFLQDFPGEYVEYSLLDHYGGLGRIQTLRYNHVLYMPMTHIADKTTKEWFVVSQLSIVL